MKNILLGVLAALAFIRFVGIPYSEWVDSQWLELEQTRARLAKALSISGDIPAFHIWRQQVDELYSSLDLPSASFGDIRGEFQSQVNQFASLHGCKIELFDWLDASASADTLIQLNPVNLRISGRPFQVASCHAELGNLKAVNITAVKGSWGEALNNNSQVTIAVQLNYVFLRAAG
jgi:hypothetical protein